MKASCNQIILRILTIAVITFTEAQGNDFRRNPLRISLQVSATPEENKFPNFLDNLLLKPFFSQTENTFNYRIYDDEGNVHYHAEDRSRPETVKGCYGYKNINGLFRIVEYTADEEGYRTKIYSNEPGIPQTNPAHVVFQVRSSPVNLHFSFAHPCMGRGHGQTQDHPGGSVNEFSTGPGTSPERDGKYDILDCPPDCTVEQITDGDLSGSSVLKATDLSQEAPTKPGEVQPLSIGTGYECVCEPLNGGDRTGKKVAKATDTSKDNYQHSPTGGKYSGYRGNTLRSKNIAVVIRKDRYQY